MSQSIDHQKFRAAIGRHLDAHPEGLSEFDLLRELSGQESVGMQADPFACHLSLFQAHFLLFHVLYLWRDVLLHDASGDLEISCLRIRRLAYRDGEHALTSTDPMRAYYLDLRNLDETGAQQVEEMLGSFWTKYFRDERRVDALAVLGLEPGASEHDIKRCYHGLALEHHPDRGGDEAVLQKINAAMAQIKGAG